MSLFVGKEKPGRIVIFLGALRRKHVILILMVLLVISNQKEIKWMHQMEGYILTFA